MNTDPNQNTEREEKKKAIIQAALKAYSFHGLDATTRQIAEIAGIGKTTIYEYFQNKDALLQGAFDYLAAGMEARNRAIHEIAREDPLGALNRYLDNAIHQALDQPALLLLISQYSLGILLKAGRFDTAKAAYKEKMYPFMESLTEEFRYIIRRGIGKGVFYPPEGLTPEGMVYTVCALIREIQAHAFLQDREELIKTCTIIRETVNKILGIRPH